MGIPKFFRWISERYPMCSKLISQNKTPEFDNLYLDMNGIIHNCSHNINDDIHYRISELEIWTRIFSYVDHLIAKVKPKKMVFLAIDGVAPRAKMNQQRSRRFRTAHDLEINVAKAGSKGKELPEEPAFDSNCITPGTEFMAKLTEQLRYFVALKVSEDTNWQGIKVILSSAEVPGEGEHKIMEYIRAAKAQPDYDPNTRHCLYGLDADLIMLGLLTHDPHFALLREEVSYGVHGRKRKATLESQNFFLMHLTLLREYLDLEFKPLKPLMHFHYDLERIIDDFILLVLFIGNDFVPILPGLQVQDSPLGLVFEIYKTCLVTFDGYLQDSSIVNFKRLQNILVVLGDTIEKKAFENERPELLEAFREIELYLTEETRPSPDRLYFSLDLSLGDRKVVETVADDLGLYCSTERFPGSSKHPKLYIEFYLDEEGERYPIVSKQEIDSCIQKNYNADMKQWKRSYYKEKMNININNNMEMDGICRAYATGIQWVLSYYYNGVPSWSWFYPYHYAPKITDLVNLECFQRAAFDLGKPLRPYEQLMGVLPALSRKLLPEAYQELMTSPTSPIRDFYPSIIEADKNGRRNAWEAVIKIPFIDAERLLDAMKPCNNKLTIEEERRAEFGHCYKFEYQPIACVDVYTSPLPDIFPDIRPCFASEEMFQLPHIRSISSCKSRLLAGVKLGKEALAGFPSLKTIAHTAEILFHSVNVFQQESRNDTMVITLINQFKGRSLEDVATSLLGECVYIEYPNLQEAIVVGVSDQRMKFYFEHLGKNKQIRKRMMHNSDKNDWLRRIESVEYASSLRSGLIVGKTNIGVHVCMLQGMKRTENGSYKKEYVSIDEEILVPLQIVVTRVANHDARYVERYALPLKEECPVGSKALFLGSTLYGYPVTIVRHRKHDTADVQIIAPVERHLCLEPTFGHDLARSEVDKTRYIAANIVSNSLGISALVLSKITSSLMIQVDGSQRINIGLNLKFEAKKLKVAGYTRRNSNDKWEYSKKAIELIKDYIDDFPEFVDLLLSRKGGAMLHIKDFYWANDSVEEIDRMRHWLKVRKVHELSSVSFTTEELDEACVKRIVESANRYYKAYEKQLFNTTIIQMVPRNMLLIPADADAKLHAQTFELGDRVIYALSTGLVRLGSRGTVVAVRDDIIDVVFDETFVGGNTLGSKCPPARGFSLPLSSMLNLTAAAFVVRRHGSQLPAGQNSVAPTGKENHTPARLYADCHKHTRT